MQGGDSNAEATALRLVGEVLSGNAQARNEFVVRLTPVVHHRVARVVALNAVRRGAAPKRQDLLDFIQDVFVVLLESDGRVIRSWKPERGLSLENFVGLVAERETQSILRSGRRSGWAECPEEDVTLGYVQAGSIEEHVAAKQELEQLAAFVSERLSPKALLVFRALFVACESVEETSLKFGMSATAVYTFRSRFRSLIEEWHQQQSQGGARVFTSPSPEPKRAPTSSERQGAKL